MDYGIILRVLGVLLIVEAIFMFPSFFISLYANERDSISFIISIIITLIVGLILLRKKNDNGKINPKTGLIIVTLGWVLASIFGALPLYLSNTTNTYIESFFEMVSAFTTTGASVITDVESLSKGMLFWRTFGQWIGGMGILVFTVALLPILGIGGYQIFKAESPGPIPGKIVPRVKDTAKILYVTYFTITFIQIFLLVLSGMPIFDSLLHSFGTVATGGFGIKNNSIGHYNSVYIDLIIGVFMLISGINFSLYYTLYLGRIKDIFYNEEFRLYLGLICISTIMIGINLYMTNYKSIGLAFKDGFFQVSSITTTTGYTTVDFKLWPSFSRGLLFLLMFIGGSAGSTAGGMKVIRILIMLKLIKREIIKIFHPRAMVPIKNNGKTVPNEIVASIYSYFAIYILILAIGTLLVSLEGVSLTNAGSAVITTLGNMGPVKGLIGGNGNFAQYSQATKLLLSFLMLLGRLEFFTVLALLLPKTWIKEI